MSFDIELPKRFRAFISVWSLENNEVMVPTKEFLEKESLKNNITFFLLFCNL